MKIFTVMFLIWASLGTTVFYFLTLWTDRSLEFWLTYFAGHQVIISNWWSALFTLLFNAIIIGLNVLSEIIRLAL